MAWEIIRYSCGHHERQLMPSPNPNFADVEIHRDVDSYCPACREAADVTRAEQEVLAKGYAKLIGHPSEVSWAETIRVALWVCARGYMQDYRPYLGAPACSDMRDRPAEVFGFLASQRDARWFISHRYDLGSDVCAAVARELSLDDVAEG